MMHLGAGREIVPAGVGPDGAVFLGQDRQGALVTIYRLRSGMEEQTRRRLERRFDVMRAWRIQSAQAYKRIDLAANIVIVDRCAESLAQAIATGPFEQPERAIALCYDVARALADLHRAGLVHGFLDPHCIGVAAPGATTRALVDTSGLRCSTHTDAVSRLCRRRDEEQRAAVDIFALGAILLTCLEGPDGVTRMIDDKRAERTTADAGPASTGARLLASEMLEDEPAWRPTAAEVARRLASLAGISHVEIPVAAAVSNGITPSSLPPSSSSSSSSSSSPSSSSSRSSPSSSSSPPAGGAGAPPSAVDAELRTSAIDDGEGDDSDEDESASQWPTAVGRFEIVDLLGEGAMGRVFKARDRSSAELVALKLVNANPAPTVRALKRFKKEARLLAEVKNPGVAALVDAGDDNGRLWMAVEYVEGETLSAFLSRKGPLEEREALSMVADCCRALVDIHERGIVHRDVKPDNILVVGEKTAARRESRIKIIDFGIARHLDESQSLAMTRMGAVMGTPLYMPPEQARGQGVDARSDVYALGTVLYELLAGSAPFAGNGASLVLAMQQEKTPPKITEVRPQVSDECARVIVKCLEKDPAARYQNARELLDALLQLLDEAPATIKMHPARPGRGASASSSGASGSSSSSAAAAGSASGTKDGISRWSFEWDLKAAPRELWPYVSNTDRLNRAIGLGAVDEHIEVVDGDAQQFGHNRQAGFDLRWREHPYEWVHERRIGVLREYSEGPLRSMRSTVDLIPIASDKGGGTHLVHSIEIDPRGVFGRAAAAVEIGVKTRRALEKVYRRIDDLVSNKKIDGIADVFEPPETLGSAREERLQQLEKKLVAGGADAAVVARLGDLVHQAPAMDLARIRPIALARKLGFDDDAVVRALMIGAREGMFVPLWDLLCPSCRAPADIEETLRAVKDHAHCEVCNVDFSLDLATSIELVFRVHPQLRAADAATYCLSSPGKSPHVMAQIRVMPGEHFLLETELPEGSYQLMGRRLPYTVTFRVRGAGQTSRWELSLKEGPSERLGRVMRAGKQTFVLHNDTGREQLVRVEKTTQRDDVFTAAKAAAHPLFRHLFPNEVLEPGALVRIASVVLLQAELRGAVALQAQSGDPRSFSALYAAYKAMETVVASEGGSVVKIMGDGVLAVFDDPAAAVRASWKLNGAVAALNDASLVRAGVHRGPAAAVTLNDRLDYFGSSVNVVTALARDAKDGGVLVSDAVMADPVVQEVVDERARKHGLPGLSSEEVTSPLAIA